MITTILQFFRITNILLFFSTKLSLSFAIGNGNYEGLDGRYKGEFI